MKLIVVHYHLRPGGIRRIIELATPHVARALRASSVTLACGEVNDQAWNEGFTRALQPVPVKFVVQPTFNYLSEQHRPPTGLRQTMVAALDQLLAEATPQNCLVWAHNLGIARNLLLSVELARACEQRGVRLLSHHHDWWFDNRWLRWPEMRRSGVRTLADAARAVFPAHATIRHIGINRSDARVLQRHFGRRARWVPNLTTRAAPPDQSRVRMTQRWLRSRLGVPDAPVWLLPCRLLRRKNIAEALLLTRWLRPDAWLVTTGGVSSRDEQSYFRKLSLAARRNGWPLRLAVLDGSASSRRTPSVAELLAASECVLLTSVQEGFGLPYLEAAAAARPLIARSLPNIAPDLDRFGFRFPQTYDEINVHTDLFDWPNELDRQRGHFDRWKRQLPPALRKLAAAPGLLLSPAPPTAVPFSRLTLSAQLEVLAQPTHRSWELCAPLNPFLTTWQTRAANRRLHLTRWPRTADDWLSGPAYARALLRPWQQPLPPPDATNALNAQRDFFQIKLAAANSHPLLWDTET